MKEGESMRKTYTLKGSFGSEVSVTLNETFPPLAIAATFNNQLDHATPRNII